MLQGLLKSQWTTGITGFDLEYYNSRKVQKPYDFFFSFFLWVEIVQDFDYWLILRTRILLLILVYTDA